MTESGKSYRSLILQVSAAAAGRLVLNTSRRFIYPFAPVLSRGLGVELTAVTLIIAVNQFTSTLSLIFGPLADRWGHRFLFIGGLGVLTAGMFLAGLVPVYAAVLAGFFLAGVGKAMFDPAILGYVGSRVPYKRRGMAVGALEVSWAGSSLIGIPLIGILIDRFGWRAPFFALGAAALLMAVLLWLLVSAEPPRAESGQRRTGLLENLKMIRQNRPAMAALAFAFLFNGASDAFFVIYGVWLEGSFGLTIVSIGAATTVIGAAELAGEGVAAALADRIGLERSLVGGAMLTAGAYLLLPLMGASLPFALGGIFLLFLFVEFAIVVALSFFTEVLPGARATMMAGYFAAASAGRFCGAALGSSIWIFGGIEMVCRIAAVMAFAGLLFLIRGIRWMRIPR